MFEGRVHFNGRIPGTERLANTCNVSILGKGLTGIYQTNTIWALTRENLSLGVCEQHRHRPACASAKSDQRLCYLLFGKYHM